MDVGVFFNKFLLILIVCIQWQIRGVLKRLNNDPVDSLSCARTIILITLFCITLKYDSIRHNWVKRTIVNQFWNISCHKWCSYSHCN